MANNKLQPRSVKRKKMIMDTIVHIFLAVMCVIWLLPLFYILMHSFRAEKGQFVTTFLPETYTFDNYVKLFTDKSIMNFPRMFMNTFVIAVFSCMISTFFVLSVSYCLSRLRFKLRKPYMNFAMVITLFPGFMSMMAVYFILKAMGLTEGSMIPVALVICFSSGAGTGFYVMKGYMDTIPKSLDEAAYLDGATKWQTYTRITLPLCKPMIVYQVVTAFMGPWCDYIFARLICRDQKQYYTVSVGLWDMLKLEAINSYFTQFCAGAVVVAIPISILFIITQKFYQEAMSGSVKG